MDGTWKKIILSEVAQAQEDKYDMYSTYKWRFAIR